MNLLWNRYSRNVVLFFLRYLPIHKGLVICISWCGTKYNCNPRAIVEEACLQGYGKKERRLQFYYVFEDPEKFVSELPEEVIPVTIGTLEYFRLLSSAQFIIANTRFGGGIYWPFKKKKGQLYIQTMHGGHGLKKQELEVVEALKPEYVKTIFEDASRIDLMISDSKFWTEKARTIFAYPEGEILEEGLPRNDVFFASDDKKSQMKKEICKNHNINYTFDTKFLVYCPTFRNNGRKDVYGFIIEKTINALETKFGGIWYILVSSHPNMQSFYQEIYDFSHPRLIDVGKEDLQPILVSSDAALTDYSSAGFEFALTNNPCFLLCRDLEDYDRGVYFDMKTLPFPYAETDDQLIENIKNFDNEKYLKDLEKFNKEIIGLKETGHASEAVVNWMLNKM